MPNWHISYQLYHNILPKIKSVLIRKSQKFPEKLFGSSSHVSKSKKSFQQAVILVTGFKNLFKIYFFFLGSCLTILIEKIANNRKQSESANIICYWRTNPHLLWLRDQKVIRGTIFTEVDDDNKFNSDNARSRKVKRTFKFISCSSRSKSKKKQKIWKTKQTNKKKEKQKEDILYL